MTVGLAFRGYGRRFGGAVADDRGGVGCPARPPQFGQDLSRVVIQAGEKGFPARVDGFGSFQIAGIEFLDIGRIGTEEERGLLGGRWHVHYDAGVVARALFLSLVAGSKRLYGLTL